MPAPRKSAAEPAQAIGLPDLSELLHAVLHETRGSAGQIQTLTQLLQRREAEVDPECEELIGHIGSAATRLGSSLDAVRRYTEALDAPWSFVQFPAETALSFAINRLTPALQTAQAQITHGDLLELEGDPNRISTVFYELLSNAIKFCENKPPIIHISCSGGPEETVISVKDNGIGIVPDQFERILKPFTRLWGNKFPGAGMGLAICKLIVEMHGGRLWLESNGSAGSTFHFKLPARS